MASMDMVSPSSVQLLQKAWMFAMAWSTIRQMEHENESGLGDSVSSSSWPSPHRPGTRSCHRFKFVAHSDRPKQ